MERLGSANNFIKIIQLEPHSKLPIDYEKCLICQSEKPEEPTTPSVPGYASLCRDFASFIECKSDSLPSHIVPSFESSDQFLELLIQNNAKYHKNCRSNYNTQKLNRLIKQCRKIQAADINVMSSITEPMTTDPTPLKITFQEAYDKVFQEIAVQIENSRGSAKLEFIKMSQLAKTMSERIYQMGFDDCVIHSSRLKDQLLVAVAGLRADKVGREVFLSFDENVKHLISFAIENDINSDEKILARATELLRKTYIDKETVFSGSLNTNFTAETTVSKTLTSFLSALIDGHGTYSKIAENIAQIIQFNSVKSRKADAAYVRHNLQREQPLPIYLGLMAHSLSGKRQIVDELFDAGLSVAYSRILDIERALAAKICRKYIQDDCVCPPHLKEKLFTTAAIDNIDHNPQSTTARYSFHGTGISLIQHYDCPNTDDSQQVLHLEKNDFLSKSKPSLPKSYTDIPKLPSIDGQLPLSNVNWNEPKSLHKNPLEYVETWLQSKLMSEETYGDIISWSAYNSRTGTDISTHKSSSAMLPLIKDNINSPSVVRHTIDLIIKATKKLNPTQTPVIIGDQPVVAILKEIQWLYPEKYGVDKIVVMMGGLHIEKSFLAVIGTWLEGSGWEQALVKAGIATPGVSEGILKSSHIKRARYAHEVSLMALNIVLFEKFKNETGEEDNKYVEWIETKRRKSVQFQYWITTMELQAILLQFVKSERTADFDEFISVLEKMCPWYLATDHGHYGRWLPIILADMKQLSVRHPEVYKEFKKGHFTSRRTNKKFSCISDDQFHEQNNKLVKESSSLLGMLNDESSLVKWMVSGPEVVRLIWEYRNITSKDEDLRHHEDRKWFQSKFANDVKNLVTIFQTKGPFCTTELTTIGDERKTMDNISINNVVRASDCGSKKYQEYLLDRIIKTKTSIHDTIHQSKLNIFKILPSKTVSKDKMKLAAANMDSNLFCRLFIACESRKGNVDEFFMHENSLHPPSLSEFGKRRKPAPKDDMLKCLLKPNKNKGSAELNNNDTNPLGVEFDGVERSPTALIINAFSLVQNQLPIKAMTVKDYSLQVFEKCVSLECDKYSRVDVVFDINDANSLEYLTNENCSKEKYMNVIDNETKLFSSKTWFGKFLDNINNKTQFLKLLASNLKTNIPNKHTGIYVCARDEYVVISKREIVDFTFALPIENNNTRMLLHVEQAVLNGHQQLVISTSDVNVIVVAIYAFKYLMQNLQKLWVELVSGNSRSTVAVHDLYKLHHDKSDILPFLNAFMGCETTSTFYGIGKQTALNILRKFPIAVSAIFKLMTDGTPLLNEESKKLLERFTILMYDSSSKLTELHHCRRVLFTNPVKPRSIDKIPPTKDTLEQHIKRSLLQAKIWTQCSQKNIQDVDISSWSWKKNESTEKYVPVWTTIPMVENHCRELIACKCKKGKCTGNCTCILEQLPCTMLCACQNQCQRKKSTQTSQCDI